MLHKYMRGIDVTLETLGYEVIAKVGHDGHFLGEDLTLERCRSEFWQPAIADRNDLETWMAGGLGRVLGAYDEMVFRSMVRDNSYIYDVIGLESEGTTIDFQIGVNSYLYGTRFMSYLAYKYGPEKVLDWAKRTNGSKAYFAAQFKNVFDVSLDKEWAHWINWENQWQQANLASIRENPTTSFRPLSSRALGSISRALYDPLSRRLFAAVLYPGQVAHIAAIDIDTGDIEKICEIKDPALYFVSSLALNQVEGQIFYTTDNNSWRDLYVVDIRTGKSRRLMKDVRTGDITFNQIDKSLWGVRHFNGISTLVRIPQPYNEWNQIYSFPYGQDIFDIDISPNGSIITASLVEISGKQKLIKMDVTKLMKGEINYRELFDFENSAPESFVFSQDGRYLFGSSYYSGVSNIYRYDFKEQDIDILSNCESGFFRPVPYSEDSLIVMNYTGEGFIPVMIANRTLDKVSSIKFLGNEIVKKHPLVKEWILEPPSSVNIDSLITFTGEYNTISNVRLSSVYPIVEGYKDYAALGLHANFADLLGLTDVEMSASYSPIDDIPSDEQVHLGLKLHHWQWTLSALYNDADFYDLFGPTKTSRKGYSVGLNYAKNLIYDKPKTLDFNFNLAWYGGLERLPDNQNVLATYDQLLSGNVSLRYNYMRWSLGAVDLEKGIKWGLVSQGNYVNGQLYPRIYANFDLGIPLPINHSSIWLRSSAGYSFGDRENPFVNFFFGGFGNNWVDRLSVKRYRQYYSFPGVDLNAFGGKNYGKVMLEWNLAPIRFRRCGFTSLYLRWARASIFSSAIRTNIDVKESSGPPLQFGTQRTLFNVGSQIDFRIVMFSRFNSTFSIGYAAAVERNQRLSNEFMISLKIL